MTDRAPCLHISRTTHPSPAPTRCVCIAAASLGVVLDDLTITPAPATLVLPWRTGPRFIAIAGPSGSGKSTLLRDIMRHARAIGETIITLPSALPPRPAIDLMRTEPIDAMRRLARAGLGDMRAFMCPPRCLSTGQQARLALAIALQRAEQSLGRRQPVVLAIDEFGDTWDRTTTRAVASLLHRWRSERAHAQIQLVIATSEEHRLRPLRTAHVIRLDASGRAEVQPCDWPAQRLSVRIAEGDLSDLDALAPLHYRPGHPATIVRVLVARVDGTRAGVLAISMPVLNASWRCAAWGPRYSTGDRARDAARINRELRCISRVIVDPAFRSLGVARALVRHYLRGPMTQRTEALAAMGHAAPFFEAAGMRAYHLPPPARHVRLLDAFAHLGIDPWRLTTPALVLERMRSHDRAAHFSFKATGFIDRELRIWARRSRATAACAGDSTGALLAAAARTIVARPIAYAHWNARL